MKRWSPFALAGIAAIAACSDDARPPSSPSTSEAVLGDRSVTAGAVTDAYVLGDVVHGAVFTTTFDGGRVNENTHYGAKTEVYADGGPRNANSQAAGLPDGLYVFQITDPAGKVLLSMDPSRCRVVVVAGGVIANTVAANHIPGLGAAYDTWDDQAPRTNPTNNRCHIEEGPPDAAGSAGARHDVNTDTELGGGKTVQMWPFHDTPNPGGVYKMWFIPLRAYVQNRTGGQSPDDYRAALNVQTAAVTTTGPGKKTVIGFAPDPGFKNPSRRFVKTDNFKVNANPPFISVVKYTDVNGDALRDAGDTEYAGWPVSLLESVTDGVVGGDHVTPTGAVGVPFDTPVIVCERMLPGWSFSFAYVGSTKVTPLPSPTTDEQQRPIVCVQVPGVTSAQTVTVAFGNTPPPPQARISIAPTSGVNEVSEPHTLTATMEQDPEGDGTYVPAPGVTVTFAIESGPGELPTPPTCTTASNGSCATTLTNAARTVGTTEVSASGTVLGLTRTTGTTVNTGAGGSANARKFWVDAHIAITPSAVNGIGEPHVFTITFTAAPGAATPTTFGAITWDVDPTPDSESSTCATPSVVGNVATCTVTINHGAVATFTANAYGSVTMGADQQSPGETVLRDTDPATATISGHGANANNGPATKTYIDGSIVWRKVDGNTPAIPIGGATFRLRRTNDRLGAAVTPNSPDLSVADNTGQNGYNGRDTDARPGWFKVEMLPLGSYCLAETAPPAGYLIVTAERCGIGLSIVTANATTADFVNSLIGRMTGGSGKVELTTPDTYLTSGFTIHCDIRLSNNLEINWPGNRWHLDKPIATALCLDAPGVEPGQPDAPFDTFIGTASGALNGQGGSWVEFVFVDGGEPGKRDDQVMIRIWRGAIGNHAAGIALEIPLTSIRGNIQAHEDQPHRGK